MENKTGSPITAERDDMIGRPRSDNTGDHQKPKNINAQVSSTMKVITLISFFGVLGIGAVGWNQYQGLLAKHENLLARFELLKSRLSSTDESVTQSGAAMQITISKNKDELKKHWSEIRKLWGVSNDTNKSKIANNKKDITFLANKREKIERAVGVLESRLKKESSSISDMAINHMALTEELGKANKQLRDYIDQLNRLKKAVAKSDRALSENADAINAMDSFRRNMTQKIYELEQRPLALPAEVVVPIDVSDP